MRLSLLKNVLVWVGLLLSLATAQAADDILPADKVFIPKITALSDSQITIDIDIKPGYYLYRQRLFSVKTADNLPLTAIRLSDGIEKTDAFFGTQSIWYGGKNTAQITLDYANPEALKTADIRLKYQGCQDGVICYPPQTVTLPVALPTTKSKSNPLFSKNKPFSRQSSPTLFGGDKKNTVLPQAQAFPFSIEFLDDTTLAVRWRITDGYYLYRDKIQIDTPNLADVQLSQAVAHRDDFFGEQMIYRGDNAGAQIHLSQPPAEQAINLSFQGCADKGVCYPVMKHRYQIGGGKIQSVPWIDDNVGKKGTANPALTDKASSPQTWVERLTQTLSDNIWLGFALLLLGGVALSFTPCVLPMLPILLGIITNQRQVSKSRAAVLSSAYALGVAVMMAVFGLVVAKTGINLQIIFQKPLWLILFAAIFMLMGLAMLGVFSLAMPGGVQNKIYQWQNRFQDAKPSNLFIVGALSTLVVGPCVAPPLIAVLAFIATTNNSLLGALYLFALGLGMSLPLVVFATVVTTIPKTGAFSRLVTRIFALLMFGVGLWLLSRLLSGALALCLWGVLMFAVAWVFWRSDFVRPIAKTLAKGFAVFALIVGATWGIGGIMGNSNPLKPFTKTVKLPFTTVSHLAELQQAIADSKRPVMLDLYADWCVSCQELEHLTFTDPKVAQALQQFTLLKLDISDTTKAQQEILDELGLIAPPVLLFFKDGKEIHRQIGTVSADELLPYLQQVIND